MMTTEQLEALEEELIDLNYKDGEWTDEDLKRQDEITRILNANGWQA